MLQIVAHSTKCLFADSSVSLLSHVIIQVGAWP